VRLSEFVGHDAYNAVLGVSAYKVFHPGQLIGVERYIRQGRVSAYRGFIRDLI